MNLKPHKALFWEKKRDNIVHCKLCPRNCVIKDGSRGNCGARVNDSGILYSYVYGLAASAGLDPIEKKPLYHFLPGEKTLSFGTAGCNLHCMFCQNWEISQCDPEHAGSLDMPPKKVISDAKEMKSRIISYTYSEPAIFYEYMYDTARLAKKNKMRNVVVSNGFTQKEPLKKLIHLIDAANIDLKGNEKFYRKVTGAWIEPILESLIEYKKKGVWLEVTNLIIPGMNDSDKEIKWLVDWVADNLGKDTPLHFSAFWPTHKMKKTPSTTLKTLQKARKIGMKRLNYVYTGNLPDHEGNNTYCPSCGELMIQREGFHIIQNNIKNGKCECGQKIAGVWK